MNQKQNKIKDFTLNAEELRTVSCLTISVLYDSGVINKMDMAKMMAAYDCLEKTLHDCPVSELMEYAKENPAAQKLMGFFDEAQQDETQLLAEESKNSTEKEMLELLRELLGK